jgi:hypothetical protein
MKFIILPKAPGFFFCFCGSISTFFNMLPRLIAFIKSFCVPLGGAIGGRDGADMGATGGASKCSSCEAVFRRSSDGPGGGGGGTAFGTLLH